MRCPGSRSCIWATMRPSGKLSFRALYSRRTMNEAIITDVTRMLPPKVCIAALQGARTIRLNRPQPDEQMLSSIGGLLPGDRISVEWLDNPFYEPPHVEDGIWEQPSLRKLGRVT